MGRTRGRGSWIVSRRSYLQICQGMGNNRAVESRDSMALFRCRLCTTDQVFGYCPSDDTLYALTGSGFQARSMLRIKNDFEVTRSMRDETAASGSRDHVIPRPCLSAFHLCPSSSSPSSSSSLTSSTTKRRISSTIISTTFE
jgi:hypothetical protein